MQRVPVPPFAFYSHLGLPLTRISYNVTPEDLFDLFGKFGPVRCVHTRRYPTLNEQMRMCL